MAERAPSPRAVVLSIGDELVAGLYPDLNGPRIARSLLGEGIEVARFLVVPDDAVALAQAMREAAVLARFVLASGGLGPTLDDVTREAAAEAAGTALVLDEAVASTIEDRYRRRGLASPPSNRRQALFPRGARLLANPWGTAPGFRVRVGASWLFCLPGPPREMEAMLEAGVLPLVRESIAGGETGACRVVAIRRLHGFGVPEAVVGERLAPLMARGANPQAGTTVRKGVITVSLRASAERREEATARLEEAAAKVREALGDAVFGEDGVTLPEALASLLLARGVTIATAESCTGGLLAKCLTDVPGISAVYLEGFVLYADEAKVRRLGVPEDLLRRHGAVSEEVARAMAEGVARVSGARLGLAVTGIAGPSGGTAEKPVGLVHHALCLDAETQAWRRLYPPADRRLVRDLAARDALNLARLAVLGRAREGP